MGRGRAKAKQVKVARQLKYGGGGTDLDRLRAELGVDTEQQTTDGNSGYRDRSDRYAVDDDSVDDDDEEEDWGVDGDLGGYAPEHLIPQSSSSSGA